MNQLKGKRIYDSREASDGFRILVDRLWPRGIKKIDAQIDEWAKEIAPSNEIRKKFHADHDYAVFYTEYMKELECSSSTSALVSMIQEKLKEQNVTLLTASRDIDHCNLSVLLAYLHENMQC